MKALLIRRYGGPDVAELADVPPPPRPGPRDLLVDVKAASVNPLDYKIRGGGTRPVLRYRFPLILGNDLAGVVREVGAEVTRFRPGDAVYARLDKDRIGAFAEQALVGEDAAARKPSRASFAEAASLALVGLTSWQALVELGHVGPGQKVFITAGSGGVGTFAIQLARHLGATVATTVGARNADLVRRLGAEVVIDYRAQRFWETLRDQDVVLDTQGGETLVRAFDVVRRGGLVVTIGGVPNARFARDSGLGFVVTQALRFMTRKASRAAARAGAGFEYLFMAPSGAQLERIAALVDEGAIRPVMDSTFPLERAREALDYVEAGRATGKVVIEMMGESGQTG